MWCTTICGAFSRVAISVDEDTTQRAGFCNASWIAGPRAGRAGYSAADPNASACVRSDNESGKT
jgi:hypothetical protein